MFSFAVFFSSFTFGACIFFLFLSSPFLRVRLSQITTTAGGARCRFSDLRNDWLAGGDVARSVQTNYTVRVEQIPRAFRSPAMLQKFFSTIFPGQVRVDKTINAGTAAAPNTSHSLLFVGCSCLPCPLQASAVLTFLPGFFFSSRAPELL